MIMCVDHEDPGFHMADQLIKNTSKHTAYRCFSMYPLWTCPPIAYLKLLNILGGFLPYYI